MADAKKVAMGIGIAIILALFIGYMSYEIGKGFKDNCIDDASSYCCRTVINENSVYNYVPNEGDCYNIQGNVVDLDKCEDSPKPMYNSNCNDVHSQWYSITAAGLGLIAVILGIIITSNGTISGGLIAGGIISMITALGMYWGRLEGWMRVVAAGILLTGLIILAWFKLKD